MSYGDDAAFRIDGRVSFTRAWPQYASLLLGGWLFVSAFLLPHTWDSCAASWIMGSTIAMNAFAAIWAAPARYFNALLGLMSLGWQTTAAAHEPATLTNGVLVSGLVIVLSVLPARRMARVS